MAIKILNPLAQTLRSEEQIVPIFPSRADLEGFPDGATTGWPKGDAIAITLGRTSRFDGIYGFWAWNETSNDAPGVSVVVPTVFATGQAGRWIRIFCECGALR